MTEKKNIILDATLLTSIMTCGRFTDLRFNHQLVSNSGKSNSLEVGSIVHKVLEVYYKSLINHLSKKDAIANGIIAGTLYVRGCEHCTDFTPTHHSIESTNEQEHVCNELCELKPKCGHPPNEYPGTKNTPPDSTSEPDRIGWKYALDTCEQYFEFYKGDHWIPLETEVVKREVLYEDDEIRIMWKAKLDLTVDTNQGIYSVDHKTMKQRRDTLSLNNQFIGQCILMKTRVAYVNKIGWQTSLKPEKKFLRVGVNYSADRLMEWQSEILPYWAYQLLQYNETGYWTPNFTHCEGKYGNCIFKEVCESDRNLREDVLKNSFIVGPKWDIDNVED